ERERDIRHERQAMQQGRPHSLPLLDAAIQLLGVMSMDTRQTEIMVSGGLLKELNQTLITLLGASLYGMVCDTLDLVLRVCMDRR
ncbi:hypothetical protein KIPB_017063, partial [Kipferlia bialata]